MANFIQSSLMPPNFIQPIVGMIAVTAGVWGWMYVKRLRYLQSAAIDPQTISTPTKLDVLLPHSVNLPAYNFKNLFEMPVLFYVLCLCAQVQVGQLQSNQDLLASYGWLFTAAWCYVALRAIHSFIQCSYNKVMHRFIVYLVSCLVLWVIAIKIALMAWL